jgi:hypothetical protein
VDRADLEKLRGHAFSQPEPDDLERTHAVIVVQRGAIVAERYAHDAGPDNTCPSEALLAANGRWKC